MIWSILRQICLSKQLKVRCSIKHFIVPTRMQCRSYQWHCTRNIMIDYSYFASFLLKWFWDIFITACKYQDICCYVWEEGSSHLKVSESELQRWPTFQIAGNISKPFSVTFITQKWVTGAIWREGNHDCKENTKHYSVSSSFSWIEVVC